MKSFCVDCKKETNQEVLSEFIDKFYSEFENIIFQHSYQIIRCQGCDKVSFRILFTDDYLEHEAEETGNNPWKLDKLFPMGNKDMILKELSRKLPQKLRRIYQETLEAFNFDNAILCCAGIRAIIEGICVDKKILVEEKIDKAGKRRFISLAEKIKGLVDKDYLTKQNEDILHTLRFIGNDALHNLEVPAKDELKIALDIIDIIVKSIYDLPDASKRLKINIGNRMKAE